MFRSLLIATVAALLPTQAMANPGQETKENDFLDLVDGKNNVLVQGRGVDDVNAKAPGAGSGVPCSWVLVSGGSLLCETGPRRLQRRVPALTCSSGGFTGASKT